MFKNPKLKNIFFLGFLFSLHLAFTAYVNSSFLSVFSGEKNVALIYVLGSTTSILMLLFIPEILRKIGEYKFLLYSSGLSALFLLLLSLFKNPLILIPIFIFYFSINSLIFFALDELLEIFSQNSSTGRMRGLYLTCINLAWVISQFISGKILSNFSFSFLYFLAFSIMAMFFLVTLISLKDVHDPKYDKVLAWQSFKIFFKNKNLSRAYQMNFLLQFFYVWMVIYTPLYLHAHLGFDWKEIGVIFTIMLLPFVLIQFPLGNYSDKIGERKILIFGFFIISLSTLLLFFIQLHAVWIWALMLFCTRIGAAIIEVMSDVYFFKHINKENDEYIAVYRNTAPISYVLAPMAAFIFFLISPSFNFIFLVLGIFMMYGIYLAYTIEKSDI